MPRYDYECMDCKHKFIRVEDFDSKEVVWVCTECGSLRTKKIVSKPTIIFKGKGFYSTDSKEK